MAEELASTRCPVCKLLMNVPVDIQLLAHGAYSVEVDTQAVWDHWLTCDGE